MVDHQHPLCLGYVVGLPHPQIERLLSSPKNPGEFVVRYEKSLDSPPVACLYNAGTADWGTEDTLIYICPFCSSADPSKKMRTHEFEAKEPVDGMLGWYGIRRVRCMDGRVHDFGLYYLW